jgi:signal-transduction protein with cAMP-binding, CBS, and nucleotidyltransferase domain
MRSIDAIRRSGVGLAPDATVHDAAVLMEAAVVGALAVVDGDRIIGIVTDRDLVRRVMARSLPPDARVDAVMTAPVVSIDADADVHDAFAMFRTHGLRRLAVTRDGRFVGMLSIDDLLIDLAADLADLARPITAEAIFGHRDAPVPATS